MNSIKNAQKKKPLGNDEIINGLINGRAEAFYAIYPVLDSVLNNMKAKSNPVLIHEAITSREALLSHLFLRGKITEEKLSQACITDIYKWIWVVAKRELISVIRSKQKNAFVRSLDSYDANDNQETSRCCLDRVHEITDKADNEVSAKDKFDAVVRHLKTMSIDKRYEVIFYGLADGNSKKEILPKFIETTIESGKAFEDESRYSANYDLIYHRWNRTLNMRIPYKRIISNLTM